MVQQGMLEKLGELKATVYIVKPTKSDWWNLNVLSKSLHMNASPSQQGAFVEMVKSMGYKTGITVAELLPRLNVKTNQ